MPSARQARFAEVLVKVFTFIIQPPLIFITAVAVVEVALLLARTYA
jgi:hypothetical protein